MRGYRDRSPISRAQDFNSPTQADKSAHRVIVHNMPHDMNWRNMKALFADNVGDVSYAHVIESPNKRPTGSGIVEFTSAGQAKRAIEKMNGYEMDGRKLSVKMARDNGQRDVRPRRNECHQHSRGEVGPGSDRRHRPRHQDVADTREEDDFTFGLSTTFLDNLGITGPLNSRVFFANLCYEVPESKVEEIFRVAGRIVKIDLAMRDGQSRGFGVVEFTHPVEAVQAVSMFRDASINGRKLSVRMDHDKSPADNAIPHQLPPGIENVGPGLGPNGRPLTQVPLALAKAAADSLKQTQSLLAAASSSDTLSQSHDSQLGGQFDLRNSLSANRTSQILNAGVQNQLPPLNSTLNTLGLGQSGGAGGQNLIHALMGNSGAGQIQQNQDQSTLAQLVSVLQNFRQGSPSGGRLPSGGLSGQSSQIAAALNILGANSGQTSNDDRSQQSPSTAGRFGNIGDSASKFRNSGAGAGHPMPSRHGNNQPGGSGRMTPGPQTSSFGVIGSPAGPSSAVSDTILIRNLPMLCTWENLREGFSHCGDIKFAEMKDRGVGMVRFSSSRDAEHAVSSMNGHSVGGRAIDVTLF